ncbi:BTAD domain-containing putative transcriptional regulator [Aquincola tertiaricarbonis]|uniref:BTAD domain-containing putative transcriptional regulator n=1 Tax=Aquincola tertiaricarbonis TaxID=391953 RepID=UPI0006154109|nr:BTAD domain-containing putative transcriptional regulator [Aquincola tertiaricarbonis]
MPRLQLLGGFELLDAAGHPVILPYDKARALLALLCLQRTPLEREATATMLWPDSQPAQALANLRRALFDLKRSLAPLWAPAIGTVLPADRRRIALATGLPWQIDCLAFEQAEAAARASDGPRRLAALRQAVSLYRGPLLHGVHLDDAPGFDAWLTPRRQALHHQALEHLVALAAWLLRQGELSSALDCAQRALALDPWCEPALRCAMQALSAQQPAQALALHRQFSQRLREELGVDPQPETQALAAALRQPAALAPAPPAPSPAQRRRVVALVCEWEVVGPTTGSPAAADVEALAARLLGLQARAQALLQAHGGCVLHAQAGELLAFFGHPAATDQAPRLALDGALALMALGAADGLLLPRLGLHVGWVHAPPGQASPDVMGTLSREARRLAVAARAGTALVSLALQAQSQRYHRFATAAHGGLLLAGPRRRPAAADALPPLVGRQAELDGLLAHWTAAQTQYRAVWLQGEPGLGKTRLLQALEHQVAVAGPRPAVPVLRLQCRPEMRHSPWHAAVDALRRRLGSRRTEAQARAALQRLLQRAGLEPGEGAAPLAQWLWPGKRMGGDALQPPGAAEQRSLHRLWIALYQGLLCGRPHLLVIEDLHWADASLCSMLALWLSQPPARRGPGLLVLSSRRPPPTELAPGVQVLALGPLCDDGMAQLIDALPDAPEGAAARRQVLSRAQGVPLFAQELARSLCQAPHERVPATLWDLLAEQLERLPPAQRRLAQCAAVLGSRWDEPLLWAVADEGRAQADRPAALQALADGGLIQPAPAPHWHFRHALLRDAAYESLGTMQRQALHARAADALQRLFPRRVANEPALLAWHLHASGDAAAAHYWWQAGCRAASQSAHAEARHLLTLGLQALAADDAPPALRQRLLAPLHLQLGTSLLALQGYGSRAARRCFEQALASLPPDGAQPQRFQALWGLWLGSRSGPDEPIPALRLADELAAEADRARDEAAALQAAYARGNNLLFLGRLAEADSVLQAAAEAGEHLPAEPLLLRFGEHGGIAARALRAWTLALQGRAAAAQAEAARAVAAARRLDHAQTLAFALAMAAVAHRHLGQPGPARPLCEALLAVAQRHDLALWQAVGALLQGWCRTQEGDAGGLQPIAQAVAASAVVQPSVQPTFLSFLAEAQLRLGLHAQALATLEEALALARERQAGYLLPELQAMRAQVLRAAPAEARAPGFRPGCGA